MSWIGQQDPRVDAVVACDNLCDPALPTTSITPREDPTLGSSCLKGGVGDPPGHRVPRLGITADTFTGSESRSEDPDPVERSGGSRAFSRSGRRHRLDRDPRRNALRVLLPAEHDLPRNPPRHGPVRVYTTAWMDKYVKHEPTANARLLSTRWRSDIGEREVDPEGGGNLFSFYFRSRLDLRRDDGTRFVCEDLRAGCAGMVSDDGWPARYSSLAIATAMDGTPLPIAGRRTTPASSRTCLSRRTVRITVKRRPGVRIRRVVATVGSKRVGASRGGRITVRLTGLPRGTARVTLRITARRAGRTIRTTQRRTYRLCAAKTPR